MSGAPQLRDGDQIVNEEASYPNKYESPGQSHTHQLSDWGRIYDLFLNLACDGLLHGYSLPDLPYPIQSHCRT